MKKVTHLLISILCLTMAFTIMMPTAKVQAFNKTTAKKNITVSYKKLPTGILVTYKNKNKTAVKLSATMKFLDADKAELSKEKQENLCLGANAIATFFFAAPRDEYGNCINYSSYKCSFSVAQSKYKTYAKKIAISSELDQVEAKFAAVNNSGRKLSHIHSTIVFYNSAGTPIRCFTKQLNCFNKNSIYQFVISYPDDMAKPSKVKVYIDWAY